MTAECPRICKAARIDGHSLVLRDAAVADAVFIHALRTDRVRARFLSPVPDDVRHQIDWLARYALDDAQAYFVVTAAAGGEALGTVRLYGARGKAFSWGSWLLRPGLPAHCAIESALMVYQYALRLGFVASYFDVRVENASVWRFHERFGARRVACREGQYRYELPAAALQHGLRKYRRFLPGGIHVLETS